ncbi:uncharacterized protein Bfra_002972 [Botrytis fragariae]|uniref:Uncharacterized protein n=1 Tax=Botrytis fragariae TaxID=1964551 RepID=A0A8H6AZX1_9HELO|nr:uncharacterized protein Bfra_002972 [Botrytis fragariae]KAF5876567.1 hypothetical protein Bfra_002972 [Botrytis fragariae]
MASGSKERVPVNNEPDTVDEPCAIDFDADRKDSLARRWPPQRRYVNDIILERRLLPALPPNE